VSYHAASTWLTVGKNQSSVNNNFHELGNYFLSLRSQQKPVLK
jgi:hypothetical protein